MSTPSSKPQVQYPVGALVARYKNLEHEIKLRLQLQTGHTLQEWQNALRSKLSETDLEYLHSRTRLSVMLRKKTADRLIALRDTFPSEWEGHCHMITVQESNQAAIEHQLARAAERKQSGPEPISEEPHRDEDLEPHYPRSPHISKDGHDDIHKADALNDALCLFASIRESLAAVACLAGKISSGLSLVPYGLAISTVYTLTRQAIYNFELTHVDGALERYLQSEDILCQSGLQEIHAAQQDLSQLKDSLVTAGAIPNDPIAALSVWLLPGGFRSVGEYSATDGISPFIEDLLRFPASSSAVDNKRLTVLMGIAMYKAAWLPLDNSETRKRLNSALLGVWHTACSSTLKCLDKLAPLVVNWFISSQDLLKTFYTHKLSQESKYASLPILDTWSFGHALGALNNVLLRAFVLAGLDPSDSMQGVRHFLLRCYTLPSLPACVAEILEYFDFEKVLQDRTWYLRSRESSNKRLQRRLNSPSQHLLSCLFQHGFRLLSAVQDYLFGSESPTMTRTIHCVYQELSKQLDHAYNGFKIEWAAVTAMDTHYDSKTFKAKRLLVNEFQARMLDDEILTRPMLPHLTIRQLPPINTIDTLTSSSSKLQKLHFDDSMSFSGSDSAIPGPRGHRTKPNGPEEDSKMEETPKQDGELLGSFLKPQHGMQGQSTSNAAAKDHHINGREKRVFEDETEVVELWIPASSSTLLASAI